MAIVWCDGFDHQTVDANFTASGNYVTGGSFGPLLVTTNTRTGTGALQFTQSLSFNKTIDVPVQKLGYQLACRFPASPTGPFGNAFQIRSGSTVCAQMHLTPSLGFLVFNTAGAQVAVTANNLITLNAYDVIEAQVDRVADTFELRINGVQKVIVTGGGFGGSGLADNINIVKDLGNGANFNCDDFIIWDGTGTINNDFLGIRRCSTSYPTADDALMQFVAYNAQASRFPIAAQLPTNDAQYIEGVNVNDVSQFQKTGLSSTGTGVAAVRLLARAKASNAAATQIRLGINSNSVVTNGPVIPLTTAYAYYSSIIERDPNTAAPWTRAAVDLALARITRAL